MKHNKHLLAKDHAKIHKLKRAKQRVELDTIDKIRALDQKIAQVQQSTRTTIPLFIALHNSLRVKFHWYYAWHLKSFASLVHIFALILICTFTAVYGLYLFATTSEKTLAAPTYFTWLGDGDGTSWTDPYNWDQYSGYPSTSSHVAIITSISPSMSTPNNLTLATLELESGYTGTITLGTGTITLSNAAESAEGNLIISGGTLTAATNNPNISIMGNLTIASGATFTKGTGTLTFSGETAKTYTDSNTTKQNLGKVTIGKTSGTASNNKITLASSMTVDTMTINTDNTLDLASSGYTLKLANSGSTATVLTVSGTLTPGTSTVEYAATNSGGNINVVTTTYSSLKFSGSETYDLSGNLTGSNALSGDITIDSGATLDVRPSSTDYNFTCRDVIVNGTLDGTSSSATMEATRNWTHNSGTFNYGTTTVKLTGDGSLNAGDGKRFYRLQMAFAGKTTTLANSARVDNVLTTESGAIESSVSWSGYIAFFGTGDIYVTDPTTPATWGATTQVAFWPYGNINLPKAHFNRLNFRCNYPGNCDVTLNGELTVANVMDIRGGGSGKTTTFNTNGNNVSVGSDILIGTTSSDIYGKLNINNSTVTVSNNITIYTSDASGTNELEFSGTSSLLNINNAYSNADTVTMGTPHEIRFTRSSGTQTLDSGGTGSGKTLHHLTHSGAGTLQLINNDLKLTGNFSQTAGTFDANSRAQIYNGNFSLSSGTTFTKGGTISFEGTSSTTYIDSTTTKQNIGSVIINKSSNLPPHKVTLNSSMTVDTLTINGFNDLDLGNSGYTLKLANAGATADVFTKNGLMTINSNSIFEYAATNSSGNINVVATAYNHLKFSGSETYSMTGHLTSSNVISGNLSIESGATLKTRPASTDYNFSAVNVTVLGTLDAGSSSSVLEASGDWVHNNGTFTRGTSTVKLTGSGILNTTDGKGFHHLELAPYVWTTTTLNNQVAVWGNLTTGSGTVARDASFRYISFFGNYYTDATTPAVWDNVTANWYNAGNRSVGKARFYDLSYRGNTASSNTLTLNGDLQIDNDLILRGNNAGHIVNLDTNSQSVNITRDLHIGLSGSTDRYSTFTINGSTVTVGRDTIIQPSDASGSNSLVFSTNNTIKTARNFTINDTVSGSAGTIELNGSSNQTITTNAQSLPELKANNSGTSPNNKVTVSGNLSVQSIAVTAGNLDLSTNNPNVTISGTGLTIASGATFSFSSNGMVFDNSVMAYTQYIEDSSSPKQILGSIDIAVGSMTAVAINSDITAISIALTSGYFNISNRTLTLLSSSPLSGSGSFTTTNSTVVLTQGVTPTTIPYYQYHNLTLSPTNSNTFSLAGHHTSSYAFNGSITIGANATLTTTASNYNIELKGDWSNSGSFTTNSSTITLSGADSSTQAISGNTTFYNLSASTTANSAGRTIQFAGGSTTTVSNNWTITGASGKVVTLQSSNTTNWTINPTNASVTYADIARSTNTGSAFCANYSTDSGNNIDWDITNGATCNTAPDTPDMLAQKKTDDTVISVGGWINETSVKFTAVASDTDSSDTLYLCVEAKPLAQSFANIEDDCGSGVAYSGTPVTVSVTLTGLTNNTEYHWQVRAKDLAGEYSSWASYGANPENERDFGIDTSAPTGGTVNDGTGADEDENDGSLDELHANWSGFDASVSGLDKYEFLIKRESDNYYWNITSADWQSGLVYTNNATSTSVTVDPIVLQTSVKYIFGVRAHDNAGNFGDWVYSDGIIVLPFLSFSTSSNNLAFANLNTSNDFTDSKTNTITTSTNAVSGYVVRAYKTGLMASGATTIPDFYGTYASPAAWLTNEYGFGYTSSDTSIQGSNKFSGGTLYAALMTGAAGDIVADHTDAINGNTGTLLNDSHNITFRIAVSQIQAALSYSTEVVYIVSAQF